MPLHKAHSFTLDLIEVWSVNLCAIGITYTDAEEIIKIGGWLLAAGYTGWKWRNEYKEKKSKIEEDKK